ncbi:Membrane protease YdiL, CAAX protease family [Micromonospora sediminicola]|uniref:Membrane protease YdiL, CAAX protease family n=1 Tax=Micromonospora sediminicola TaxID=946078 RepID=A0A1A9BAL8_9ACTN|nr:CPBP family intramembrane glutamic endopeptidase [Micromonospora sediminicola]SBT65937.1 Membrane protease YdiL, CAAX protease family [Micromonospora sediminicola]
MDATRTDEPTQRHRPAVDSSRPFGAHLRMSWWKPLVVIGVPPVVMLVLQVLLYQVVGAIEGSDDPMSPVMTPLKSLAVNISIGTSGVVAVLLLARIAKVPWRRLISSPRAVDTRRLTYYLVIAAVLVGAGIGVVALVAPDSPGWTTFGVSGTTIGLLAVTVLSTPLQSTGEELLWRSAVLPAAASWVRAVRPALAVGLVVSSLGFAVLHGSSDPWLFGYFTFIGLCTGLMAIISGGVEAPVAFHVANNVLFGVVSTVMADGEPYAIDRATDSGDASLLILAAVNVAMVVLVWSRERRTWPRTAG